MSSLKASAVGQKACLEADREATLRMRCAYLVLWRFDCRDQLHTLHPRSVQGNRAAVQQLQRKTLSICFGDYRRSAGPDRTGQKLPRP